MEKIYYMNDYDSARPNILFLHGYDNTKEALAPLYKSVEKFANVLAIDLPGNKNNPLDKEYKIEDYVDYLENTLANLKFTPYLIVGHSFGGKLAAYYSLKHQTKLLLLAPSIVKPKFSMKRFVKIRIYKVLKILYSKKIISKIPEKYRGSVDYQNTQGLKRKTFLNIVHSYFKKSDFKKLKEDVYLLYGLDDKAITLEQMKRFKKYLPKTNLILFSGDHFMFLNYIKAISKLIYCICEEKRW